MVSCIYYRFPTGYNTYIDYQVNLASSTFIIVCSNKIQFYCYILIGFKINNSYIYILSMYSDGSQTRFCSTLEQRMVICMHKGTYGRHRMVKTTNETINFPARFFFYTFYSS